ncbi:MAG: cofactor-independent phosphoglycerate mutase [Dehalococcoidales bacterium]|nr:cofactor-independent phosphoglycerate mutase [Dehalococcoidales bacterium]
MKYCVLIIDGAAGLPLTEHGDKTCLEMAHTPNLDAMAAEATLGLVRTIPAGLEPSSSNACLSVLGYDPEVHRLGRAAIEARSLNIPISNGEVVFRCNLVSINGGRMADYSAGHINSDEAHHLINALNKAMGSDTVHFYPGLSYRHIVKITGREDALLAGCTPAHDIPGKPVDEFMPRGSGSDLLRELMKRSEDVLREHPVNLARQSRGEPPANMVWLFWGSGRESDIPAFKEVYGLNAAVTSAVDVIRGLAQMMGMKVLEIPGVKDGMDNDFAGQASGALAALREYDLIVIHIEATDEAGHTGSIEDKIEAIHKIDSEVISQIRAWREDALRVLVMPDHPTPIEVRTHTADPVPFMLWGKGFAPNGAKRFTEKESTQRGLFLDPGYNIMGRLIEEN